MLVGGLFTCDMGFTLAQSRVLVATGNSFCWGAYDANVTAVTAGAAIWIWGFKTVPTRQTVYTPTTCYCSLTLTLTSDLEVRGRGKEGNTETLKTSKLKVLQWSSTICCLAWCVPGHTPCCCWLFQQCCSCKADTNQLKWDQIPPAWKIHLYTARSSYLRDRSRVRQKARKSKEQVESTQGSREMFMTKSRLICLTGKKISQHHEIMTHMTMAQYANT